MRLSLLDGKAITLLKTKAKVSAQDMGYLALGQVTHMLHGIAYKCVDKTTVRLSVVFINEAPLLRFEAYWTEAANGRNLYSDQVNFADPKQLDNVPKVLADFCKALVEKRGKPVIIPTSNGN
jgi:hypothetical protein